MSIHVLKEQNLPQDCYVFKHSTRCPISAKAAAVVRSVNLPLDLFWIDVIENRGLSDWVVAKYGIAHQSPQLLLIRSGAVTKSWSHYAITPEQIV